MYDSSRETTLRPVAFMVMPFGERTVSSPPAGVPARIDCDALWYKAFRPALEECGYLAIRADMEVGSVIIKDMLERLAFAELVVADMTLPNGNVYYEVGIRHVAKREGCILIAAEGSKRLFDLGQVRTDRYPLKDGMVPDVEAAAIKDVLVGLIPKKKHTISPYHEYVNDNGDSTVFRQQIEGIHAFQGEVRTARLIKDEGERKLKVQELSEHFKGVVQDIPEVALELLRLVRDTLGWEELINYANTLPVSLKSLPFITEQVLLAKSKLGYHEEAIEGVKALINTDGDSVERWGLIGGRYKALWRQVRKERLKGSEKAAPSLKERGYLKSAIDSYKYGMELDYNEFYCSSNLPLLLQMRKNDGDEKDAIFVSKLVIKACERKLKRGEDDGWVKPTLLCAAFQSRDVDLVNTLAVEVAEQDAATWELETTLSDIDDTINQIEDEETMKILRKVQNDLAEMVNG